MAQTFNLVGNENTLTFKIGGLTLEFQPSDSNSEKLSEKAKELEEKSSTLTDKGNEWENRKALKGLLDDFFLTMFDESAPLEIYRAVGEDTISYLRVFLQIANALKEVKEKQENDEIFKKYLAE